MWVGIATLLNPIYYRSGRMHRGHAPLTLIAKKLEAEVSAAFLTELLMDDHQTWHVGLYCHQGCQSPIFSYISYILGVKMQFWRSNAGNALKRPKIYFLSKSEGVEVHWLCHKK